MSRKNMRESRADTVRPLIERLAVAFNARDLDGLAAASHPTLFEFTSNFVGVEGKPYTSWPRYFRDVEDALEDFRIHPEQVIPNADESAAAVVWSVRGRGRGSGAPIEQATYHAWEFPEGKLGRGRACPTLDAALEAVGLSEQDAHADS
jgi:ketosteroid isomerase-like protein